MPDVQRNQTMKGLTFALSTGAVSVAGSAKLLMRLSNPAGSAKDFALEYCIATGANYGIFEIRLNPTQVGTFTSATPINTNTAFTGGSVITASTANGATVDLTGGSLISGEYVPNGSRAVTEFNGRVVVTPNNSIGFGLTPSGANTYSITVIWTEAPR